MWPPSGSRDPALPPLGFVSFGTRRPLEKRVGKFGADGHFGEEGFENLDAVSFAADVVGLRTPPGPLAEKRS